MAEVIRRLGEKLPDGWRLVGSDPSQGWLEIARANRLHRLVFDEYVLAGGVREISQGHSPVWGPEIGAIETLARLMSIHLEESLATNVAASRACWTYDGAFFYLLPAGPDRR